MKKYLIFLAFISFLFTSCDKKDEFVNENSKVVEMAGDWYVLYNHSVYGDYFGGLTNVLTFNTSADDADTIWLSDEGEAWTYKVKIPCNLTNLTFGGSDTVMSAVSGYPIKVLVRNGKIMKGAALRPSGTLADSIYYEVWFEDLEDRPNNYGTGIPNDTLYVSGFRRTGFVEDEP